MSDDPEIIEESVVVKFKKILEAQDLTSAIEKMENDLYNGMTLNIAVTGRSGSGKSSFVNALCGLGDTDEGSALTGVVETTLEPKAYCHPSHSNVFVWDLPGIGTPNFKAESYLQQVEFGKYDLFIIVDWGRFSENSVALGREIQNMRKSFYFVRTKIDQDIRAEKRRKKSFDQERVLNSIRQDCTKGLQDCGLESPLVFLISNHELHSFDFNRLQETMTTQLPKHKRDTLLLALPNILLDIHEKKKDLFESRICEVALLSCLKATVQIPGLSICADTAVLVAEIKRYIQVFGLDSRSLETLSIHTGITVEEFQSCLKSSLSKEINIGVVKKMLSKAVRAVKIDPYFSNLLLLDHLVGGPLSFFSTSYMLKSSLNELAYDAKRVLERARPCTE